MAGLNNTKRMFLDSLDRIKGEIFLFFLDHDGVKAQLEKSDIGWYELKISRSSSSQLNKNLPESGYHYVPAEILIDNSFKQAEVRYHGDNDFHWGYAKKSLRVRSDKGKDLILINPKHSSFVSSLAGYWLASKIGLYTPKADFVGLFINGKFRGIYVQVERLDDYFLEERGLSGTIFRGENVGKDNIPGLFMFNDYSTWTPAAGTGKVYEMEPLLLSIQDNDTDSSQHLDFSYMAKLYVYYSFIESVHIDRQHNWNFYFDGNKYYPIVWDPVAWVMRAKTGNKVEEANNNLSRKIKKNPDFNELFYQKLWDLLNEHESYLPQYLEEQWQRIEPILKHDVYKGGAWPTYNKGGPRAVQNSKQVRIAYDNLLKKIEKRANFLKEQLSGGEIEYYFEEGTNDLYFSYTGVAHAFLEEIKLGKRTFPPQKIEIHNKGEYRLLSRDANGKHTLISGKKVPLYDYEYDYFDTCKTVYRLSLSFVLSKSDKVDFLATNKLTGEKLPFKRIKKLELSDCMMNLDFKAIPESLAKKSEAASAGVLPTLNFDLSRTRLEELVSGTDKSKKITVKINGEEFTGRISLDTNFSCLSSKNNFVLKLDDSYKGFDNFKISSFACSDFYQPYISTNLAKSLSLLAPRADMIKLTRNNNSLGPYYLQNGFDKAFFETQKRTFDTDIYQSKASDSLDISNWEKLSSDPRVEEDNRGTLELLINSLDSEEKLRKLIDLEGFSRYYFFLQLTGTERPKYLLYFNNTSGKLEFVPQSSSLVLLSDAFEINDPLINKILSHENLKKEAESYAVDFFKTFEPTSIEEKFDKIYDETISPIIQTMDNSFYREDVLKKTILAQREIIRKKWEKIKSQLPSKTVSSVIDYQQVKNELMAKHSIFSDDEDNALVIPAGDHRVSETIVIPRGLRITIHPGATIRFSPDQSILSFSPIMAQGTEEKEIKFVSNDNQPWGVIGIIGKEASNSLFEHCQFENGSEDFIANIYMSGMLSVYHADVSIKNCTFQNARADDALNLKHSHSVVSNSLFSENSADAIDLDFIEGKVEKNHFFNNGNDALDVSGSGVRIEKNYIEKSDDKCISIGETSKPVVFNNVLDNCKIAIEIKDGSSPVILNNVIYQNEMGVNSYQKKEFFSGGHGQVYNTVFANNQKDIDFKNTFSGTKFKSDDSALIVKYSVVSGFAEDESSNKPQKELDLESAEAKGWIFDELSSDGFRDVLQNNNITFKSVKAPVGLIEPLSK